MYDECVDVMFHFPKKDGVKMNGVYKSSYKCSGVARLSWLRMMMLIDFPKIIIQIGFCCSCNRHLL